MSDASTVPVIHPRAPGVLDGNSNRGRTPHASARPPLQGVVVKNSAPDIVVVLRALGLGDVLTGVPAYRAIAGALPGHDIVVLAPGPMSVLVEAAVPRSTLLPTPRLTADPLPLRHPDVAVNLHGRGQSSNRMLARMEPRRLVAFHDGTIVTNGPSWREDEHEVERWCRLVSETWSLAADPSDLHLPASGGRRPDRPTVVIHPGANASSRRWFPHRFARVAAWFSHAGCRVILTGDARDRHRCALVRDLAVPRVDASSVGRTSLWDLCWLVASAQLVVTGDTGIAHLATAYRTPSVVLFGPVSPALWGPRDTNRHAPLWRGTPEDGGRPGDAAGAQMDDRLAQITTREVIEAGSRLLDEFGSEPMRVPIAHAV
jgi:ADP-heptose:LPS heptosyltransferase